MRYIILCLLPIFLQAQSQFDGHWEATVVGIDMHLDVVQRDAVIHLTIPQQSVVMSRPNKYNIEENHIELTFNQFGAFFEGDMVNDEIHGNWIQNGQTVDVTFVKTGNPLTFNRPQEPTGDLPYEVKAHSSFFDLENDIRLSGTITKPKGEGPFPTVILISGSGPQDRDEFIFGHRPFLVIADYLTRAGYVVARYDDRGVGKSKGKFQGSTTFDFADDAEVVLNVMKKKDYTDNTKIGVIGHSEGALVGAILAARNSDVKFLISLAGPGQSGLEIMKYQLTRQFDVSGFNDDTKKLLTEYISDFVDAAASDKGNKEIFTVFNDRSKEIYNSLTDNVKNQLAPSPQVFYFQNAAMLLNQWMRSFLKTDPSTYWEQVKVPVLALNGTKDIQVLADPNLKEIKTAVKGGGNNKIKTHKLRKLNHLFQKTKESDGSEYIFIETTIEPKVLQCMEKWLNKL